MKKPKTLLQESFRTCEYYYPIADVNVNSSFGVDATESQIHFIEAGTSYATFAPKNLLKNYGKNGENDKFFIPPCKEDITDHQITIFNNDSTNCPYSYKNTQKIRS